MKTKILAMSIALLGAVTFLSSFDKAKVVGEPSTLNLTVTHDGKPMKGVLVGVATSEENRDNSVYVAEKETDAKGVVKFTNLKPGTYFLDAEAELEDDLYGEMKVVIVEGNNDVTMTLQEAEEDEEGDE